MVTYQMKIEVVKTCFWERLTGELNNKLIKKTNVIICGDFSIDHLVDNKHCFALRGTLLSYNLKLASPLVDRHDEIFSGSYIFGHKVWSGSYPFAHKSVRK